MLGKTTTLYVTLEFLNKEGVNIVTLEDPIEFYIEGVNQSQIKPEIGYTFANGLRHILRQDPDIIMVGEIRDSETAELATHAALTQNCPQKKEERFLKICGFGKERGVLNAAGQDIREE